MTAVGGEAFYKNAHFAQKNKLIPAAQTALILSAALLIEGVVLSGVG